MEERITKRVLEEAKYMLSSKSTVRKTAQEFSTSKSTVHNDLRKRLCKIDANLATEISQILKAHDDIKHIRGGEATKEKYKKH